MVNAAFTFSSSFNYYFLILVIYIIFVSDPYGIFLVTGLFVMSGMTLLKVAYYSYPKKKYQNVEICDLQLKQNDVSCEVLVTAIDVKCNFT